MWLPPATMPDTPRADGFAMPPEWEPHQLTLMSWPCRPETYVAADRGCGPESYDQAQTQQAAVANAVIEFEPVLMLVRPEQLGEARRMLSSRIELLEAELDDAWMRDNGPIFVRDAQGRVALVQFGFNGWGIPGQPYALDSRVPEADRVAPGGAALRGADGVRGRVVLRRRRGHDDHDRAVLLHENRNPSMSRDQIESTLHDHLGIDKVVWLGEGHYEDFSTDGHVDDIAHFLSPGRVILHTPSNPAHPDHGKGAENARRLRETPDARGRSHRRGRVRHRRRGGHPVPEPLRLQRRRGCPDRRHTRRRAGAGADRGVYADREVVTVRSEVLFLAGGGGPHCITQQVPAGTFAP